MDGKSLEKQQTKPEKIKEASFEADKFLGNGFREVIYQRALNYLKAYRLEVGLLINFGSKSLTFKRLVLTQNLRNQKNRVNQ
mgnify:CR=1 FL=1